MFKKILAFLFPPDVHAWTYDDGPYADCRTCATCGRYEELDPGGGMCSSMWMVEHAGDKSKHEVTPLERSK